jgi:hypothetical protein
MSLIIVVYRSSETVLTECQKYAWTKLPDIVSMRAKKTSWDKTAIFLSVWRQKKKPTKEQS